MNDKPKSRNHLQQLIKIAGSLLALYLLYTQIDFSATYKIITRSNPAWLVLAFMFFNLSQVVSAFRLNYFFDSIGIQLLQSFNLKLYYIGMFYNLLLPGGIGGDAYKAYLLRKHFGTAFKRLASAMVADRAMGLFAIIILIVILSKGLTQQVAINYWFILVSGIVFILAGFLLFRLLFTGYLRVFKPTIFLSIGVQTMQLAAVWAIWESLEPGGNLVAYLFIFLLSSVATIVPVTVGGLGLREVVFLYGARYFDLNSEASVAISLVFFMITAISSLAGLIFNYSLDESAWKRQKGPDLA